MDNCMMQLVSKPQQFDVMVRGPYLAAAPAAPCRGSVECAGYCVDRDAVQTRHWQLPPSTADSDPHYHHLPLPHSTSARIPSPPLSLAQVTPNFYGSLVTNAVAGLIGGPGICPGANIGATGAMFEQGTSFGRTGRSRTGRRHSCPRTRESGLRPPPISRFTVASLHLPPRMQARATLAWTSLARTPSTP